MSKADEEDCKEGTRGSMQAGTTETQGSEDMGTKPEFVPATCLHHYNSTDYSDTVERHH